MAVRPTYRADEKFGHSRNSENHHAAGNHFVRGRLAVAGHVSGGFEVVLEDGSRVTARRLLLAHGMRYGLPHVDGVAELWGERIFHCPYCHGWEVRDLPIAVYGCGEKAVHQALLLSALSDDVMLLCDGDSEIAAEQRERLDVAGVEFVNDQVKRVEASGSELRVEFTTGRPPLARHALFIQPDLSLASDLAVSLGAALTEVGSVETDASGKDLGRIESIGYSLAFLTLDTPAGVISPPLAQRGPSTHLVLLR